MTSRPNLTLNASTRDVTRGSPCIVRKNFSTLPTLVQWHFTYVKYVYTVKVYVRWISTYGFHCQWDDPFKRWPATIEDEPFANDLSMFGEACLSSAQRGIAYFSRTQLVATYKGPGQKSSDYRRAVLIQLL